MKNPPENISPPADLATLFNAAGLTATLTVARQDGAPLTEADRALLPVLIEGYELGRELNPSESELNAAVVEVLRKPALARTGTGGE
jgi:hypothetical protein